MLRLSEMNFLPEEEERAGVGLVVTGEYFQQGGLAGSVFAHECRHFPGPELNEYTFKGGHRTELLADVLRVKYNASWADFSLLP
ncbi:hypothetical protein GCM10027403_18340 [Arthrobacter tecti]